jgi:hypothetical protein
MIMNVEALAKSSKLTVLILTAIAGMLLYSCKLFGTGDPVILAEAEITSIAKKTDTSALVKISTIRTLLRISIVLCHCHLIQYKFHTSPKVI